MVTINTPPAPNPITGSEDADTLNGCCGVDTTYGGAGNDVVDSGSVPVFAAGLEFTDSYGGDGAHGVADGGD